MANCDRHPGVLSMFMFIGEIVGENAWLVHIIRHLRRRFAHTIATQQEMEISLRSFPFPTVLSTIYRLRRISDFRFPFLGFPDCRFPFTDLPSPTVSISGSRFPIYRLCPIYCKSFSCNCISVDPNIRFNSS